MPNTREKLIELLKYANAELQKQPGARVWGDLADILIANGVTLATDNNVGDKKSPTADKIQKLLVKSDPISEEKMRELLNGPAIFHTETDSIVPIYPYQWIPVTEMLPENYQKALCIMQYDGEFRVLRWNYIDYMWNTGIEWFREKDVTHWMPLPDPPKGE